MTTPRPTCGFHYESGGKCNDIASTAGTAWPQIGRCCVRHDTVLLGEREVAGRRTPNLGEVMEDIITPLREEPEAGDWVVVFAQVKADRPRSGRPEDITLEVFSTGDQYDICVRRDRVKKIPPPRGIADRCPHLWSDDQGSTLARCASHLGHTTMHSDGKGQWWPDTDSFGYLEVR